MKFSAVTLLSVLATSAIAGGEYGDKGYADKSYGDKGYVDKGYVDKSYGDKSYGDKSYGDKSDGSKGYVDKSYGDKSYVDKSYGDKSYDDKSYGDKSYGDKSYGDKGYVGKGYVDKSYGDKSYGGKGGCQSYKWDPPTCQPYTRDLSELDERAVKVDIGGDGYRDPAPVCKKKCPPNKLRCSNYAWAKGYPKFKGGFSTSVACKKGDGYTVTGKVGPGKFGKDYLTITYDCSHWPKDRTVSYVGVYESKKNGVRKLRDLNFNDYCKGDVCVIPLEKIGGFPDFCDVDLWVGFDGGRCEPSYPPSYGYGHGGEKKKFAPPADIISYAKLSIECYGKKECKSYCCKV